MEALFDRGWTDGLPVVPPTEARVLRMLEGTTRAPDEVVAIVPPDLVDVTVEKVAVNAVMAGCQPEYLPVVLAAVEAACNNEFNIHGVLATTMPVGPVLIVNGPIRRAIGMNSGVNVLGQGNRANSTIGRALQLVIRNVGGGRPGGVDRAAHGNPGKVGVLLPRGRGGLAVGAAGGVAGHGTRHQRRHACSRARARAASSTRRPARPRSCARRWPSALRGVHHPKLPLGFDAILVVGPDHARVFAEAGWSRERVLEELDARLQIPGAEMVRGRRRHRRGRARVAAGHDRARSSGPAASCSCTPAEGRACSLPSSAAGPMARWGASPSRGRSRHEPHRARSHGRADRRDAGAACPGRRRWRARPSACSTSASRGATSSSTGSRSA